MPLFKHGSGLRAFRRTRYPSSFRVSPEGRRTVSVLVRAKGSFPDPERYPISRRNTSAPRKTVRSREIESQVDCRNCRPDDAPTLYGLKIKIENSSPTPTIFFRIVPYHISTRRSARPDKTVRSRSAGSDRPVYAFDVRSHGYSPGPVGPIIIKRLNDSA